MFKWIRSLFSQRANKTEPIHQPVDQNQYEEMFKEDPVEYEVKGGIGHKTKIKFVGVDTSRKSVLQPKPLNAPRYSSSTKPSSSKYDNSNDMMNPLNPVSPYSSMNPIYWDSHNDCKHSTASSYSSNSSYSTSSNSSNSSYDSSGYSSSSDSSSSYSSSFD